jgi:protein-disulfide isomerase
VSIDRRPPKDQRRDAAREKARAMREAAARKHRRTRALVISAAVVVVLVIAGVVAVAVSRGSQPVAAPPGVSAGGGIVTGQADAPHTVAIYQDYQCPICKQFDAAVGPWLEQQRTAGTTKIEYRPISILDAQSGGTRYSTRSASAAACMAQQPVDVFTKWNDLMYSEQPEEGGTGLPSARVAELATQAGAPSSVASCIRDDRYEDWVATTTRTALGEGGVTGTPTVQVDGKELANSAGGPPSQEQIAQAIGATS